MKKILIAISFALILSMVGCQSPDASSGSSMSDEIQSQIDEISSQLEQNRNDLEEANSRIQELEDGASAKEETGSSSSSGSTPGTASSSESSTPPIGSPENPDTPDMTDPDSKVTSVISLDSNGQKNLTQSGSFMASDNQVLTLVIKSNIAGGNVDLFLFDPANKEQKITIGGSDDTKTVQLSKGTWAYNCTGFFTSGNVTITGTVQ